MTQTRPGRSVETTMLAIDGRTAHETHDRLATEEPLEIRIFAGGASRTLAITMRTPGNDFELAAGFAYGEGVVTSQHALRSVTYCLDGTLQEDQQYNTVTIELGTALPDYAQFERHFTMSSACGVCGRTELQELRKRTSPLDDPARISVSTISQLVPKMREAQNIFASTGGLHAAALFTTGGELRLVREDVGRHNAVDKVIGWALMNAQIPLPGTVLVVSGRASYEILQKAIVAQIPIVCAVSAPSSLAVSLAREFNVTLCAFVRGERANVYTARERVNLDD